MRFEKLKHSRLLHPRCYYIYEFHFLSMDNMQLKERPTEKTCEQRIPRGSNSEREAASYTLQRDFNKRDAVYFKQPKEESQKGTIPKKHNKYASREFKVLHMQVLNPHESLLCRPIYGLNGNIKLPQTETKHANECTDVHKKCNWSIDHHNTKHFNLL